MSDNSVSKTLGAEEDTAPTTVEQAAGLILGAADYEKGRPLIEEDLIDWAEEGKSDHLDEEAAKLGSKKKSTEKATGVKEEGNDGMLKKDLYGQETIGDDENLSGEQTPTAETDGFGVASSVAYIHLILTQIKLNE